MHTSWGSLSTPPDINAVACPVGDVWIVLALYSYEFKSEHIRVRVNVTAMPKVTHPSG